jgi:hypothetical protein
LPGKALPGKGKVIPVIPIGKVIRIEAKQTGTLSYRSSANKLPDNTLTPSTSNSLDLTANPPVVLLTGSDIVQLTAITDPPGMFVTWTVTANQSSSAPPDCDPKQGSQTILNRDKTGSFAVSAKLNNTVVVWNFVLVGVSVDASSASTPGPASGYLDLGSNPKRLGPNDSFDAVKYTGVSSGLFNFGQHAWSAMVTANLTGGGPNGDLGCDQISVQVLQNMVMMFTCGDYDTQIAISKAPSSLLDTSKGSPDGWSGPAVGAGLARATGQALKYSPFYWAPTMLKVLSSSPRQWVLQVGDSPSVAFPTRSPKGEKLQRIRLGTEFRAALAAFSKNSINSIAVYADTVWQAVYTGDVSVSGTGEWSSDGAGTNIKQAWSPITDANGLVGTTAWNARMEIFPPFAAESSGDDPDYIAKP